MTVKELAEHLLANYPHDLPVATISTCECCTSIELATEADIGIRCIEAQERHSTRRAPAMKKPGLVIAGAKWAWWGGKVDKASGEVRRAPANVGEKATPREG